MHTGLNTILISGPMGQVGKTTVIRILSAYWKRYRSAQTMSVSSLPGMMPMAADDEPDLGDIWQSLSQQQQDYPMVLIEGGGGLGTPVTYDTTMAHLARDWRLPTILVVPAQWEAIAPAIAAIALARQSRLDLVGVILNTPNLEADCQPDAMGHLLRTLTQVNLLGTIPFLGDGNDEAYLCQVASNLLLEPIMGHPVIQETHV
ncbi:MAG: AAA family ATPase [Leptolyngbyaceae bacterium]|nr:AAA family ATPase [Leptolyngbyaceae bacterium]